MHHIHYMEHFVEWIEILYILFCINSGLFCSKGGGLHFQNVGVGPSKLRGSQPWKANPGGSLAVGTFLQRGSSPPSSSPVCFTTSFFLNKWESLQRTGRVNDKRAKGSHPTRAHASSRQPRSGAETDPGGAAPYWRVLTRTHAIHQQLRPSINVTL